MLQTTDEDVIWRTYPDYPFIEVNQFGEVRTKDRIVTCRNGNKRLVKGRILKQRDNGTGYLQVCFRVNGKQIFLYVHRIVAITFIPNPDNLPEVNHINNYPTDNAVSNLEWCSRQYNLDYKKNFGTSPAEVLGRPVIAVNRKTSEVFWFESQSEAGRQLGIFQTHISDVVKGKYSQTGGYWFCCADENAIEKARKKFGDEIAEEVRELI